MPGAGIACGLVAAAAYLWRPASASALGWLRTTEWQMDAFGAFGAMSGFALAALALSISFRAFEPAARLLEANAGRFLLRMLVRSTWAWLVPALIALLNLVVRMPVVEAVFLVTAGLAAAQGLLALYALTLFFKRYTQPVPPEWEEARRRTAPELPAPVEDVTPPRRAHRGTPEAV